MGNQSHEMAHQNSWSKYSYPNKLWKVFTLDTFYAFGFFFPAFESLKNLYTHGILPRFSKSDASLHPYIKILEDVFSEVGCFAIVLLSLLITILQTH
ncbi:hypothetical protein B1F79_01705 [Coxiella-like endosymbiont of Rhipicephalus sanguineus]|uniref:hypothetical protein n=1 Tax=Coxiella-like endosymbiont of Rhipicephalus sanguineus TaxID=1955402 RepID=UPI00203F8102|nr:hypothetical protein [Coxiella-like endosymbiont of Rhipicephalus sanguineus]MBT8506384.1 hypothetical protein [Coxiella-like endosymbiont of Rhipicephalus sanguineus]